MITIETDSLRDAFGLGVAGNFAGHLEQAGEAGDFARVDAAPEAPKGLFPWYAPGVAGFLGTFPLSSDAIASPGPEAAGDMQLEPEAGVLFAVDYAGDAVTALRPMALGAFNDCSLRRPGAARISQKKNWGRASKGMARRLFPADDLDPDGATAGLRLACFLRRDGAAHAYGVDSPLAGYSYYGTTLTAWMVERLGGQRGGDGTPLEDVGALMAAAGRPARVLAGIGATRYTPYGEATRLRPGDESVVAVYDARVTAPADLAGAVADGTAEGLPRASVLVQRVEGPAA